MILSSLIAIIMSFLSIQLISLGIIDHICACVNKKFSNANKQSFYFEILNHCITFTCLQSFTKKIFNILC